MKKLLGDELRSRGVVSTLAIHEILNLRPPDEIRKWCKDFDAANAAGAGYEPGFLVHSLRTGDPIPIPLKAKAPTSEPTNVWECTACKTQFSLSMTPETVGERLLKCDRCGRGALVYVGSTVGARS